MFCFKKKQICSNPFFFLFFNSNTPNISRNGAFTRSHPITSLLFSIYCILWNTILKYWKKLLKMNSIHFFCRRCSSENFYTKLLSIFFKSVIGFIISLLYSYGNFAGNKSCFSRGKKEQNIRNMKTSNVAL